MPKGDNIRKRIDRNINAGDRRETMQVELAKLMEQVQPTANERHMIRQAVGRWGLREPTPADVLREARPRIASIVSLVAALEAA